MHVFIADFAEGWAAPIRTVSKSDAGRFRLCFVACAEEKDLGQDTLLILRDGTELPGGGIGYRLDTRIRKEELVRISASSRPETIKQQRRRSL